MLLGFVILYWTLSVLIGLWAALRVNSTQDFAVAGRSLPFPVVVATVFATWFGSEAVLGVSATFVEKGFKGVVADPFGASMCLVLVGVFFARPLYRLKLLTLGDYYRQRYGRTVEVLTTLGIVMSYLGWVGAQISALGLVFNVVSDGVITQTQGMLIGASSILIYTLFGGMWAVAVTDFMQMIVIVLGLLYIGWDVSHLAGGVSAVLAHAQAAGKFAILPSWNAPEILAFLAALVTMMLGSIPQQDVFQRVASSDSERTACWGSIFGGVLYLVFTFVPMFLAYAATLIDPQMVTTLLTQHRGSQLILPHFVMKHTPLLAQILFFGALLSAIKSCASATLLAPSVTFTENILKGWIPMSDRQLLWMMRCVVLIFTVCVTGYAIYSEKPIFAMVESAYQITLVTAFIPLACGLYWRRATRQGALCAISFGFTVWLVLLVFAPNAMVAPHFAGLLASIVGMLVGSLLSQPKHTQGSVGLVS